MKQQTFTQCAEHYIQRLRREGRHATAHVYTYALRSFRTFCGSDIIPFARITRRLLKAYESHLRARRVTPNTLSTYLRMLRAIYNYGVATARARYIPALFRDVFTGVDTRQKKALPRAQLRRLLHDDPGRDDLRQAQSLARLQFLFCGMPFADLAHLEKSHLRQGLLVYTRRKTGTPITVELLPPARDELRRCHTPAVPSGSPYLLPILSGTRPVTCYSAYREYQSALRRYNRQLQRLARRLSIPFPVSSYTLRHSWATTAKYRGVPIEMISESLGHTSIRTTQIYLKGFELADRTRVNRMNYAYILPENVNGL